MEVWIGRDGERHGPYKESEVRQWLRSGQVSRNDLGWYEGLADWQPLSVLFPDEPSMTNAYAPPMAPVQMPQSKAVSLEDYAGFWKRVAAFIIDSIVLYLPNLLISYMMGMGDIQSAYQRDLQGAGSDPHLMMQAMQHMYAAMLPTILLQSALQWLYFSLFESSPWQATPGKLALGIRVTSMDGGRISFLRATGRYFAKMLSAFIFLIGYLMVAWTQRKQGLHDMLASTLVLNGRAGEANAAQSKQGEPRGSLNA
jgi:uncharacterized RDD family membrane protein YckC